MINIAVAQSGGPTCAINASLVGVFREALKHSTIDAIFGSVNGIEGIIENHLVDLKSMIRTNDDMELLRQTPSTVLGSCRYKLPDFHEDETVYRKIAETLKQRNIGAFFYIGGNDSMDTVNKLSEYFRTTDFDTKMIGIPKTIDNDLALTDHTPGFGSAAKYVATTMREITRDSTVYSIPSVTIVEIMGRHAGWLTASSAVLHAMGETAPHLVYVPEAKFSAESFLRDVKQEMSKHKAVIVAVSEGIEVPDGVQSGVVDNFGHKYLSGTGKVLENAVKEHFGCKVRSIELNLPQRCGSHLASATDLDESQKAGETAVKKAVAGISGCMIAFVRAEGREYSVSYEAKEIAKIANAVRHVPREFITEDGSNVTDECLEYIKPLISGEVITRFDGGLPIHFVID